MDAKMRLIYDAKMSSYGKGTASLILRNTDHDIASRQCNYAVVLDRIQSFYVYIRLNFDDLCWSVIINPGSSRATSEVWQSNSAQVEENGSVYGRVSGSHFTAVP